MAKTKKILTLTRKNKKEIKRLGRLSSYRGKDLCACNGAACDSVCRENHTNGRTGTVECPVLYRIDESQFRKHKKGRDKDDRVSVTDKETSRSRYNDKSRRRKDRED